jgi:peroxiredoxin
VKRDPVILIIVTVVVSLMLVFGIEVARRAPHSATATAATSAPGKLAPDFTLQTLDGKTVHLSDFRGKPVMLNFWATWCEPCKIEMPWFVDFQKQYAGQGLQILGVAMDDASASDIAKFAKQMNVDYPILTGKDSQRDQVADLYGGVQFLPETFYIDRDGKIVDKAFGLKDKSEIESDIKQILDDGNKVAQK